MTAAAQTSALLPDRKHAPASLGRVLVLGLGVSGSAAAAYCLDLLGTRADSVTIYAGASNPRTLEQVRACEERGAQVVLDSQDVEGAFDVCIASPGISENSDFYASAARASAQVISEVEFAWRESSRDSVWIAITGTNGKTTTTSLAAHLAQACGMRANPVGNIGDTCIAAVAAGATDTYVAEVSSYQLASTSLFAPDVAVVLNITPDHLKWHGSLEAYAQAKRKVLAHMGESGGYAVLDATDDTLRSWIRELRAQDLGDRIVPIGTGAGATGDMRQACGSVNAAFLRESDRSLVVCVRGTEHVLCTADDLLIPGMHNVSNALAAASAVLCVHDDAAAVGAALRTFASLPHRLEACGTVAGATCYNDSKATNVDATLKALSAFDPQRPIVLLGGDDKGTDLDELVRNAEQHCKAVVCFGAAGPRFHQAFEGGSLPVCLEPTLEPALDCALGLAGQGDVVLLSPACASFDEFDSFEHRGDVFKELVRIRSDASEHTG